MPPSDTPHPAVHRPWPVRLAQRLAVYGITAYLTLCVYLYIEQNSLEYPRYLTGSVLKPQDAAAIAAGLHLTPYTAPGLADEQGYLAPPPPGGPARGLVVVFHGNGTWAARRMVYAEAFAPRHLRAFLYEYPGYGGRPGRPSEKHIVPEARQVIRALAAAGYGPIYVWGESLGSGVAAAVCGDPTLPVHGLVLMTAWDNVANVGLHRYPFIPIPWLMTDKYDSVANLRHFGHPICVVRSTKDEVIPPALTINLFAHLPEPKKLILQQGYGHDDWPSDPKLAWWDDALNFITAKK